MKDSTSKFDQFMTVTGEVITDGHLIIEGDFRGSFSGRELIVAKSGRIKGEVQGERIECAGHIEGNVETGSLLLKEGACQVGTVMTGELEIESGAIIDCVLNSGAARQAKTPSKPKVKINLSPYLLAFTEENRPCSLEVPWSERQELYHHVHDLLTKGKRLIKLVGEEGSGKTEFAKKLLAEPPDGYRCLELEEKVGSVTVLLKEICSKLSVEIAKEPSGQAELLGNIRTELSRRNEAGEKLILVIDDAQTMFQATMEGVLRLLSGAYGEEIKGEESLQIVLLGSPELKSNMVATIVEYFEDETNCQLTLDPLNMKDTADYLRLGLQLASPGDEDTAMSLLENEAIKEIHVRSGGSIANINKLIDGALGSAHSIEMGSISPELVKEVARSLK